MTLFKRISAPSESKPATIGNAAEEGSPGTFMVVANNSVSPVSSIRLPLTRPFPSGVDEIFAPNKVSILSVWSRVDCFSVTAVMPGAPNPASKMQDFTCADATGRT